MKMDCILYPCETVDSENCCIKDCGRYKTGRVMIKEIFKSELWGDWCRYQDESYHWAVCGHPKNNNGVRVKYCASDICPLIQKNNKEATN